MVHLVYIIIISHISVLSCHILLRPAMVRLIYIIITSHITILKHNHLIFTVLRPSGISTHKASNKQVLTNLLYILSLFSLQQLTHGQHISEHQTYFLASCILQQSLKCFQPLDKTLAHSITDIHPFLIHLQKKINCHHKVYME
jgi:hypothetical protein